MEEKKYSGTLKQNFKLVGLFIVLLEKNEDKETIITLELVKLEKSYWLCIMKNLSGYFRGWEGRFVLALPTGKETHCLC